MQGAGCSEAEGEEKLNGSLDVREQKIVCISLRMPRKE